MLSLVNPPPKYAWKTYQVIDDRNPPTLNTLHEVMSETGGVRLVFIEIIQTNTPTNAEEIDVVVTIDGTPYIYDGSVIGVMGNNTRYYVRIESGDPVGTPAYQLDIGDVTALGYANFIIESYTGAGQASKSLERHSIKVEVRQTSAIAAGARIRTKCTYEVLEAV